MLGTEPKKQHFTQEGSRVTIETPSGEKKTFTVLQKNSSLKNEGYLAQNQNKQNDSQNQDYSCKTNTDDLYD